MEREAGQGFRALHKSANDVLTGVGKAFDNMWSGGASGSGSFARATGGVFDRAAGMTSKLLSPVVWVLNRPVLGPLSLLAGGAVAGIAIKNHYSAQRDAINAAGGVPDVASPYMNSVSPQEAVALEARMRSGAGPQSGFVAAEAEKRQQAEQAVQK